MTAIDLARFRPPPHHIEQLCGDYESEAAHLIALNHREAAGFRWRYMWRVVLDPLWADFPTDARFWAGRVRLANGRGGICLLTIWRWCDRPMVARADIWVAPELIEDAGNTRGLLAVTAQQALRMGADTVLAYLPQALAGQLAGSDVEMKELQLNAPWFRKMLL